MTDFPILKARLDANLATDGWDVHILTAHNQVMSTIAAPCLMTMVPGQMTPPAALRLTRHSAQALMDAMWQAGVRPSNADTAAAGMGAVIAAMKEHIADLRIVAQVYRAPDQPSELQQRVGSF